MKKFVAILLTLSMVLALVGCSQDTDTSDSGDTSAGTSTSSESAEKQKVVIWAWDPNFNVAIMEEAKGIYLQDNPDVEFEIVEMAKADLEQKLLTNLASGVTTDLPDIVLIEDYNAQKYLQSFPGSFEDLTGKIAHDDFAGYKVELMTVDGKVYGVPFDSGVSGMFYRTDILAEAGYGAEDLENITWDEYIAIGKDVLEKTGKYMLGTDSNDGGLMRVMLNTSGAWYTDADGNVTIANNEAMAEAVRVYKEIVTSGIAKPTAGWGEWVGAINSGEAATITTGVWITGSVKAGEGQEGLWAVAPTPRLSVDGAVNASNLGGSSWYILSSSESKDSAIDFMSTMYGGDVDFYQDILVANGAVGTYLPSQSGSAYAEGDDFFAGQAVFEDMGQWMQEIPSINYGLYTYEADAALLAVMPGVYDGTMTVEEALEATQQQVEAQVQ